MVKLSMENQLLLSTYLVMSRKMKTIHHRESHVDPIAANPIRSFATPVARPVHRPTPAEEPTEVLSESLIRRVNKLGDVDEITEIRELRAEKGQHSQILSQQIRKEIVLTEPLQAELAQARLDPRRVLSLLKDD